MTVYISMQAPKGTENIGESTTNEGICFARKAIGSAPQGDPTAEYADASVTLRDVDLSLCKTADPASGTSEIPAKLTYGQTLTYHLAVTNNSLTLPVQNIHVEDTIPNGLSFDPDEICIGFTQSESIPLASSPRANCSKMNRTLSISVHELLPGETVHLAIPVLVTSSDAVLINQAEIVEAGGLEQHLLSEITYHQISPYPVRVGKHRTGSSSFVEGAGLVIKSSSGKTMDSWTSPANGFHTSLLPAGSYILFETSVPEGYLQADPIRFQVSVDGQLTIGEESTDRIIMYDRRDPSVVSEQITLEKSWVMTPSLIAVEIKDSEGNAAYADRIDIMDADGDQLLETITDVRGAAISQNTYDPDKYYTALVTPASGNQITAVINPVPFTKPDIHILVKSAGEEREVILCDDNGWTDTCDIASGDYTIEEITEGDWTVRYAGSRIINTVGRTIPVTTVTVPFSPLIPQTGNNGLPKWIYLMFLCSLAGLILCLFVSEKQRHRK